MQFIIQQNRKVIKYLQQRKSIVYQSLTNSDEDFKRFCLAVAKFQHIIIIIFEEMQEFCRNKLSMPPYVSAIVKTGRNWKRSYVVITQRPQEVPTRMMTNAKHRFYFKQDPDYFKSLLEPNCLLLRFSLYIL